MTPAGPAFAVNLGLALQRAGELSTRAGRGVDDGDVLRALAESTESVSGWALARTGVDPAALARALDELRSLEADIESARTEKEKLVEAKRFEEAAALAERERRLMDLRQDPTTDRDR